MEHRRWPASIRPGCQIPPSNSDQSDCSEAAGQALHGHTFRWWKVSGPLPQESPLPCIMGSSSARFVPQSVAEKYDLDIPDYQGVDQIVEISGGDMGAKKEEVLGLAERQG